jgi:hypothetical protein
MTVFQAPNRNGGGCSWPGSFPINYKLKHNEEKTWCCPNMSALKINVNASFSSVNDDNYRVVVGIDERFSGPCPDDDVFDIQADDKFNDNFNHSYSKTLVDPNYKSYSAVFRIACDRWWIWDECQLVLWGLSFST